ncbi:MAG: MoaD family protein [Promethearchaeota archaeon]
MQMIKVTFLSSLSKITKVKDISIEFEDDSVVTVGQSLKKLRDIFNAEFREKIFDDEGNLNKYLIILVNGQEISANMGLNTKLKDGDAMVLIPTIAGG